MTTDKEKYFKKLIVLVALAQFGLTIAVVSLLLEFQSHRIDNSASYMRAFSKRFDVSKIYDDIKVEHMKQQYKDRGIGATEDM